MKTFYEVQTDETSREIGKTDEQFQLYYQNKESFATLEDAKKFIADKYWKKKRAKMYIDGKDGESKHIGYIYRFKNSDCSHDSKPWLQEDWVTIRKIESEIVM